MDFELLIQVVHYRISHWSIPSGSISQRILAQVEGHYGRNKTVVSPEYQFADGLTMAIPWTHKLRDFEVSLYYLDERLKMDLGSARFVIPADRRFHGDESERERQRVVLEVFPRGGEVRIARILCTLSLQRVYAPENEDFIAPREQRDKDVFQKPIPGFRFKRLSKAVNWNRVRDTDVER